MTDVLRGTVFRGGTGRAGGSLKGRGVRGGAGRGGGSLRETGVLSQPGVRGKAALLAGIAAFSLFGTAAHARPVVLKDPPDTRGPLDIRRVELRGTREARFKVATEAGWTARRLQDRGYFLVHLDTFRTPHFDHFALVRSVGRTLEGSLWRDPRKKAPRLLRPLPARHPSRRTASVLVRLRSVPLRRSHFRWRVQSLWSGWPCDRTCFDRAPRRGGVLRPLGSP
jgi:hypothetical protein